MKCCMCGAKSEKIVCEACLRKVNKEFMVNSIMNYRVGSNIDKQLEKLLASEPKKKVVSDVIELFEEELRPYYQLLVLAGSYHNPAREDIEEVFRLAKLVVRNDHFSDEEKNQVRGIVLNGYMKLYDFEMAEKCAQVLRKEEKLPVSAYYALGEYFTKTRRYEVAKEYIDEGLHLAKGSSLQSRFYALRKENLERASGIRKEYVPTGEYKGVYRKFLQDHQIESHVVPVAKDEYRKVKKAKEMDVKDFVAFDIETTGLSPVKDHLTEIGAIKVKNGLIDKTLVFSELINPGVSIEPFITNLTGISDEMVKDARVDIEVLKDFLAFAEGLPLVGFNSEHFDLPFLMEAGRKIGVKIDNQSIDVMKIAAKTLYNGKYPKLSRMCDDMGIINNQAHRALSDAIATAEVYLCMANRQKG